MLRITIRIICYEFAKRIICYTFVHDEIWTRYLWVARHLCYTPTHPPQHNHSKRNVIYYMTKRMWTPNRWTSHSKRMGINIELVPHFSAITAPLLGRFSTRCWNIAAGTCFHSATRPLVRSGNVERLVLARSQHSNSSQRRLMGLRSGPYAGQSCYFTPISTNLYGPCFVSGSIVMLKQERASTKLLPQSWKHRIV
jgi:hypothetical protein